MVMKLPPAPPPWPPGAVPGSHDVVSLVGIEPGPVCAVPKPGALPLWLDASSSALTVIDVTPTFVVASALATRDFYVVHHDRDRAVTQGARDIFINILTTTGLVQRYVSDWAGPGAVVRTVSIRLGVPCYAGDTLTLGGQVTAQEGDEQVVSVTGRCGLGDHVTATVRIEVAR